MTDPTLRAGVPLNRPHTIAVVLASMLIPIPFVTGQVVKLIMDSTNPSGLDDLSAGLAYLSEILVASLIALVLIVIGFLVAITIQFTRTRSFRSIALPVTIALIQLVIAVVAIILSRAITNVGG